MKCEFTVNGVTVTFEQIIYVIDDVECEGLLLHDSRDIHHDYDAVYGCETMPETDEEAETIMTEEPNTDNFAIYQGKYLII